ncbi:phage portal protein [Mammaliicoccus sciuri]|uniref:phage portal protein n=1 Tax=Mammaliicoccus sciuri TaxID=1296 RepID=UPI001F334B28|nr:phage portal protein [Mammaliicoccus sciuri]MCE5058181.1 phage portal protein [Mammaliicoccus sciuri]
MQQTQGNLKTKFNLAANETFRAESTDDVLKPDVLREMVNKHKANQVPRLEVLENYYLGNNTDILTGERRKDDDKADHRAVHSYAEYVSQFIVGYLTGNPVSYTHTDEDTQEKIYQLNDLNDVDAINSDLALDLSIYGRAYEIVFRDEEDNDRFLPLDPKSTFVVYNNAIDKKIIAGIRYYTKPVYDDSEPTEIIEVYTSDKIHYIEIYDGELNSIEEVQHYYNDVPIIEYVNNKFMKGDFENVISLIDLYDSGQSDTANYMTDTNDALLAIVGNVDLDSDEAKEFKDANMVLIKPELNANGSESNADAKYIYKQYDVAGSEAYKSRLQNDIHKFTNTPDLNDENFSGTQSGEAMKYKLFGLEQVRATKERMFKKGMLRRYKLLFNNINLEGMDAGKHKYWDMQITFTPNLPKALKESVDIFNSLAGGLSERTRLGLLDIIQDPDEELAQIKKEEQQRMDDSDRREYGSDFTDDETTKA